jgi:DNA-binding NarL/FixJ family response regulator
MRRLLIVADDPLTGHAIRLALRQTTGFQVVGCLDGRASVGAQVAALRPDVVLVDDADGPSDAMASLREVADAAAGARVLLLTEDVSDARASDAFDAGAHGVIAKTMHPVALGTLLREIVRGNVVQRFDPATPPDVPAGLTTREMEILGLAAQGMTNGKIARELWITEQTVKFHLSNTYRKLGVANRTEASRYAFVNALVPSAPREREPLAAAS